MALDDDIRALARVDMLASFTQEQLRLLAFGAEPVPVGIGRDLYREGNLADSAFVIVRGEVALHVQGETGASQVGHAGAGAILGGFALLAETRRLTSATALTDVDTLRLSRKLFRRVLDEYPEAALSLARQISAEFHGMVADIQALEARFAE